MISKLAAGRLGQVGLVFSFFHSPFCLSAPQKLFSGPPLPTQLQHLVRQMSKFPFGTTAAAQGEEVPKLPGVHSQDQLCCNRLWYKKRASSVRTPASIMRLYIFLYCFHIPEKPTLSAVADSSSTLVLEVIKYLQSFSLKSLLKKPIFPLYK